MRESVKNFIEKNILALEEGDIVLFLYLASVQLSRQDVTALCGYLDVAGIEYKDYIPDVIEELVKDNVVLQHRRKVPLASVVATLPIFNYTEYIGIRDAVANAIRKIYPNKVVLPDNHGIKYVMEKI